jgi:hypothetical protein
MKKLLLMFLFIGCISCEEKEKPKYSKNNTVIIIDSSNGNSITVEQSGNGSSYVEINGRVYSK